MIGSGDSQDIEPQNVSPGGVAFGMVYFATDVPVGSNLSALTPTYPLNHGCPNPDEPTRTLGHVLLGRSSRKPPV